MPGLLQRLSFKLFLLGDRVGLHILPKHYYSPVPDYHWLKSNKQAWIGRTSLVGIHWELDEQLEWLAQVCKPYYYEVAGLEVFKKATAAGVGPGFGSIESQILHCFLRTNTPSHVVEIGSGVSTACIVHASELNRKDGKNPSRITCIEPYPSRAFRDIGHIHHIQKPLQNVPYSVFEALHSGDLLFIDSSHSVKVGSDVIRIYLDIIPRLAAGVFLHIHDITLPYLYERSVLAQYYASQETPLLLALLINNSHLEILACLAALHYDRADILRGLLSDYTPRDSVEGMNKYPPKGHFPNSLWLRTK